MNDHQNIKNENMQNNQFDNKNDRLYTFYKREMRFIFVTFRKSSVLTIVTFFERMKKLFIIRKFFVFVFKFKKIAIITRKSIVFYVFFFNLIEEYLTKNFNFVFDSFFNSNTKIFQNEMKTKKNELHFKKSRQR